MQTDAVFLPPARQVSNSPFWLTSSILEWGRCQVSHHVTKKRVAGNIAAMVAAYAILVPYVPQMGAPPPAHSSAPAS